MKGLEKSLTRHETSWKGRNHKTVRVWSEKRSRFESLALASVQVGFRSPLQSAPGSEKKITGQVDTAQHEHGVGSGRIGATREENDQVPSLAEMSFSERR